MMVKVRRIPAWLMIAWTVIFILLAIGNVTSGGGPGGLVCMWGYCGAVSLWSWVVGMVPLGLLWYATRPGTPRLRIGLAILATMVAVVVLFAGRQWPEVPPPGVMTNATTPP